MSGEWLDGLPGRGWGRKKKKPRPTSPPPELEDSDDEGLVCVLWMPIRCPHCKSKHQRNYKTKGRLRYHHCQDCGERFKSLEAEPEAEGDG